MSGTLSRRRSGSCWLHRLEAVGGSHLHRPVGVGSSKHVFGKDARPIQLQVVGGRGRGRKGGLCPLAIPVEEIPNTKPRRDNVIEHKSCRLIFSLYLMISSYRIILVQDDVDIYRYPGDWNICPEMIHLKISPPCSHSAGEQRIGRLYRD